MSENELPKFNFNLPKIESFRPIVPNIDLKIDDHRREYYAEAFYNRLASYIIDFEAELDLNQEVGAKLVSFGESIIIHVDSIGYWNPQLISFNGVDTDGNKVQLIQHVNQISFLLIALPRINPDRPRIGYKLKKQLEEEES